MLFRGKRRTVQNKRRQEAFSAPDSNRTEAWEKDIAYHRNERIRWKTIEKGGIIKKAIIFCYVRSDSTSRDCELPVRSIAQYQL